MREIKYQAFVEKNIIEGRPAKIYPVLSLSFDISGVCKVLLEPCGWIDSKWVTLREYIGLKDKNEVEIYKGDAVNHVLWGRAIVKFGQGTNMGGGDSSAYFYGYYLDFINKEPSQSSDSLSEPEEIEVIGNIYANPELLKGSV